MEASSHIRHRGSQGCTAQRQHPPGWKRACNTHRLVIISAFPARVAVLGIGVRVAVLGSGARVAVLGSGDSEAVDYSILDATTSWRWLAGNLCAQLLRRSWCHVAGQTTSLGRVECGRTERLQEAMGALKLPKRSGLGRGKRVVSQWGGYVGNLANMRSMWPEGRPVRLRIIMWVTVLQGEASRLSRPECGGAGKLKPPTWPARITLR